MKKIKKPILIVLLLILIFATISSYTYAQEPYLPDIKAHWSNNLQQISVTWDEPLTKLPDQEAIYLHYKKNSDNNWKSIQLSEGATGKGIIDVEPDTEYTIRLKTALINNVQYSNEVSITTPQELRFGSGAEWTASGIYVKWTNATKGVTIDTYCNGELRLPPDGWAFSSNDKRYSGVSTFKLNNKDQPKQGETWTLVVHHDGETQSHTVFCGKEEKENEDGEDGIIGPGQPGDSGDPYQIKGPIPIFTEESWPTVMFWYIILASLSGVFIFLALIRSGYQYMFSATSNPGLKASFSETIEKCIIALVVIMTAPMLVGLLIQINDGLVKIFADVLNNVGSINDIGLNDVGFEVNFINKMIAWPIKLIFVDLPNKLFGLHPLSHLIFNNETNIIDPCIFMGYFDSGDPIDLGDPLATVIVTMIFAVFNIIFNAIYTIRGWVVTAVLCATPLVVWIWVVSAQKTVIEIWLSELFQTIFMQTWHALTFAIIFSILLFRGNTPTAIPSITENFAELLIMAGKFFAAFGGVICVGIIIYSSYKLIISLTVTEDSKHITEYKTNLQKALIGLVILSLALIITQTMFPHEVPILQPNISGGHAPTITVWQLFFAFFVILPISKMLSNIFMSILARFGTVDEQAEAVRGFGMLGGLATLGAVSATGARSAFLSNERQAVKIDEARRSINPNISDRNNTSDSQFNRPSNLSNNPDGARQTNATGYNQSDIFASSGGNMGGGAGIGGGNSGMSGYSHQNGLWAPGGTSGTTEQYEEPGIYPPSGDYSYSDTSYSDVPETPYTQEDSFRETLGNAGLVAAGSSLALGIENTMRTGGYLAGATVGQGHAAANVFGAVGKHGANVARTFAVGRQLWQANKGENRTQTFANLQEMTGRSTTRGAIVQTGVSAALIPLGSYKAAAAGKKIGSLLDWH